jgi:hypothetical protein
MWLNVLQNGGPGGDTAAAAAGAPDTSISASSVQPAAAATVDQTSADDSSFRQFQVRFQTEAQIARCYQTAKAANEPRAAVSKEQGTAVVTQLLVALLVTMVHC